jgi:hypothetical protein
MDVMDYTKDTTKDIAISKDSQEITNSVFGMLSTFKSSISETLGSKFVKQSPVELDKDNTETLKSIEKNTKQSSIEPKKDNTEILKGMENTTKTKGSIIDSVNYSSEVSSDVQSGIDSITNDLIVEKLSNIESFLTKDEKREEGTIDEEKKYRDKLEKEKKREVKEKKGDGIIKTILKMFAMGAIIGGILGAFLLPFTQIAKVLPGFK